MRTEALRRLRRLAVISVPPHPLAIVGHAMRAARYFAGARGGEWVTAYDGA